MTRRLVREEGIYAGGSSGGAVVGALKWLEQNDGPINVVVILPDSASRYLSKIFDDEWMREHGFMAHPTQGLVIDLLRAKERGEVISVRADRPVREVVEVMKEFGVSQLPILTADDQIVGVVSESDVLNFLLRSHADSNAPIKELASNAFAVVEPSNPVSILGPLFSKGGIVLALDQGKLVGILTKIDFIDYVSHTMG